MLLGRLGLAQALRGPACVEVGLRVVRAQLRGPLEVRVGGLVVHLAGLAVRALQRCDTAVKEEGGIGDEGLVDLGLAIAATGCEGSDTEGQGKKEAEAHD